MVVIRAFDVQATNLQRQGQLALWPPSFGQEAAQVGSARAARAAGPPLPVVPRARRRTHPRRRPDRHHPRDARAHARRLESVRPEERQHAHLHARARRRRRCTRPGLGDGPRASTAAAAPATPSATRPSSSTTATARRARATCTRRWSSPRATARPRCSSCRTTSGRSRCRSRRSRARRCTSAARATGCRSIPVDGNDVLASWAVTRVALDEARSGSGPRAIEAMTYRMGAHTTSDDPTKYRTSDEEESWRRRDPIARMQALPARAGRVGGVLRRRGGRVRPRSPTTSASAPAQLGGLEPTTMFEHVYSEPHPLVDEQRAWFAEYEASFEEGAS